MIKPRHIVDAELQLMMKEPLTRLCEGVVPAKKKTAEAKSSPKRNTGKTKANGKV